MNSKNYLDFVRAFSVFCATKRTEPEKVISTQQPWGQFEDNIKDGLRKCHIFEMDDNIKDLLAMTKVPADNSWLNMPFDVVFLDVEFTKEEMQKYGINVKNTDKVTGIIFRKGYLFMKGDETDNIMLNDKNSDEIKLWLQEKKITPSDKISPVGENLRISTMSFLYKGHDGKEEVWFDTFNKQAKLFDEFKDKLNPKTKEVNTSEKKVRDFVNRFVLSFLNFINTREVEYIRVQRSEKNRKRREKKGLIPLPDSFKVTVKGELKRYVYEEKYLSKRKYGYQFDVMGHWRHYNSDKYVNMKGKVKYIKSFKKGSGVYIKKNYEVKT